ncbi:MAG: hypothetical protein ACREQZ_07150 [Woeseiaceae bacterium]
MKRGEPGHVYRLAPRIKLAAGVVALAIAAASNAQGAPFRVPLGEEKSWQVLRYRNLPPHRVRFSEAGLEMAVEGSAMPLIYPLPAPVRVRAIRVAGRIEGALRIPPGRQGEEKFDDYAFRIGLRERQHPLSELLAEKVVAVPRADGRFDFAYELGRPLDTVAVWLSSDGDDTGSRFTVLVERIELALEKPPR